MERLWISGEGNDHTEVRSLMQAETVEEQLLAIDALTGWCRVLEDTTSAPIGKNFYDCHHFQNKSARRGQPYNILGNLPEYKIMTRRDIHCHLEAVFGWLGRLPLREVIDYINGEEQEAA